LERAKSTEEQSEKSTIPFKTTVTLNFITGIQKDTKWFVGYGPRKIGAYSVDLPIFEKDAPDICFEIRPQKAEIEFVTSYPKLVKINNKSTGSTLFTAGDVISINNTRIQVSF
jgi:hypothetical protein